MKPRKPRAAIIGAGISGLTTAVVLGEAGYRPMIFADQMPADTTSAVAAALWLPYDAEPHTLVDAWALMTYGRLLEIIRHDRKKSGVSLIEFRLQSREEKIDVPVWANAIGYRLLCRHDMANNENSYQSGFSVRVPLMETPIYLPYMKERVKRAGGSIKLSHRLNTPDDLPNDDFDVIVNCSGYGARDLVPDLGVECRRGQVVIVPKGDQQWAMVCEEPLTYVIPRQDGYVLGGVNEKDKYSREVDPAATATILERCSREGVDVKGQPVKPPLVGIRPYRKGGVCVELSARLVQGRPLIHNYGHGGCGLSLSWGCAQKVLQLADTATAR